MIELNKIDQQFLFELVLKKSGIVLDKSKWYLIHDRLSSLLEEYQLCSLPELIQFIKETQDLRIQAQLISALTTNETLFFRDLKPFELLKNKLIPELIEKNQETKTIQIWSAACSTGQEAYSIAMTIRENFPQLNHWNIPILATDICQKVLTRGVAGVYTQAEINRGLPVKMLVKYFTNNQDKWEIKEELKRMVTFKFMNFVEAWPAIPRMDIIFLRNVLIYFNPAMKKEVLSKMRKQLNKNGSLILGASESIIGLEVPLCSKIYDDIRYFAGK